MARGKKKESALTPEEKLAQALVPVEEQPYKVPENWCWTRIASLCSLSNGKAFKPTDWGEVGLPIVRIQNLNNPNAEYNLFSGIVEEKFRLLGNELLFAWSGTPGTSFGAHIWWGKEAVLNQHIFRVDFDETYINKIFFKDAINQQLDMLISVAHGGAGLQHVTKGVFESTPIPLPPLAEQQRIVDRIEYLFAKLDDAKEKAQSVLDSFETRKAAILHKAFTGELTAKWRAEHGLTLDSWENQTIGDVIKVSSGKGLTAKNMVSDGLIPVYGGNGVAGYHNESNVEPDTVVIGRVGFYCGSVHYISEPAWVTDNALIVSYKQEINKWYLVHLLRYADLRQNDSSTAQPVVSGSKIYPISIKTAPIDEQAEIVRILDSLFAKEQQAKEAAEAVLEKIDLLKKSILARAFRGELGTNDPTEESALELLKTVL